MVKPGIQFGCSATLETAVDDFAPLANKVKNGEELCKCVTAHEVVGLTMKERRVLFFKKGFPQMQF